MAGRRRGAVGVTLAVDMRMEVGRIARNGDRGIAKLGWKYHGGVIRLREKTFRF